MTSVDHSDHDDGLFKTRRVSLEQINGSSPKRQLSTKKRYMIHTVPVRTCVIEISVVIDIKETGSLIECSVVITANEIEITHA